MVRYCEICGVELPEDWFDDICSECREEQEQEDLDDDFISIGETDGFGYNF